MRTYRSFAARILAAAMFVTVPAFSQNPTAIPVVRGEIRSAGGGAVLESDLVARLVSVPSASRLPQPAMVATGGSFEFRDVAPGSYLFQLVRLPDQVLMEQPVQIAGLGDELRFELPKQASMSYSGAPTVSVRQLQHPPSKAALRAFAQAQRDSAAGNHAKAIEELRKAVAQSPEYAQAWSNLGAQYLQLTQVEAGISALEEAARLMPEEALIHTNLSYAYHLSSRWDRAETEVRKALQLDRNYMRAHYVLGQLLLLRGVNLEEAVENLKVAREEIPRARIVLANYYLRNAQEAAAEQELRAYMARAKGDDKVKAERWLAALSRLPRP